jgi:hypothetical protein
MVADDGRQPEFGDGGRDSGGKGEQRDGKGFHFRMRGIADEPLRLYRGRNESLGEERKAFLSEQGKTGPHRRFVVRHEWH